MSDTFYRYEDVSYAHSTSEFGDSYYSELRVELRTYPVLRRTSKGVWIDLLGAFRSLDGHARERFVLTDARKKFAHPTLEEARASFIARKKKQIRIYKARIQRAQDALAIMGRNDRLEVA